MLQYDKTIFKYDSDSIVFNTNDDFSTWTLKYLVKKSPSDNDADAILSIEPQYIVVDGNKKIYIPFAVIDLKNVELGTHYHALKVSKGTTDAHTLMYGKLTISGAYIQFPEVIS